MKKIRITKKLQKAIEILSEDGRGADCSWDAFKIALQKRKLKPQQLYKVMSLMRYAWSPKHGYWIWRPLHAKSVQRMFKIVRAIDNEILQ